MKVLVVGGAGYIGSILCQEFLSTTKWKVNCIDNLIHNNHSLGHLLGHPNFSFSKHYTRSAAVNRAIAESDVIIPLAAIVGAPACDRDMAEAYSTNEVWIKELVSKLSPDQRVVFPNTNSMYGKSGGTILNESSPAKPLSFYAETKYAAEQVLLERENSLSFRLATVFGVSPRMRMDLLVNNLTNVLYNKSRGEPGKLVLYEANAMRNYVHIRDVARAFIHGIKEELNGIYNLGNPDCNQSKKDLLQNICGRLQIDFKKCVELGEGKDQDQRDYIICNEKLIDTGFEFKHSLIKGIDEVISLCSITPKNVRQGWNNL
jgi:nucleoside-diphosphate-sugar epimerase